MGKQWWPQQRPADQPRRGPDRRAWDQARRRRARARRRTGLRDLLVMTAAGVLLGLGYVQFSSGGGDGTPAPQAVDRPDTAAGDSARPGASARTKAPVQAEAPARQRRFTFCHSGGGRNCVVDGDTFWMDGEKIRIADIDTPETHPSRCAREAALGARATERLHALLNEGPFTLEATGRDTDRYGRKLRVVSRGGESLGGVLVAEGLAREWEGSRRSWCG